MKQIADNLTQLIGNTPLLRLSRFGEARGCKAELLAKLESFNPMRSAKDRAAYSMLETAKKDGLLGAHTAVVEPTSGNTGIGLAFLCALEGRRIILTMPDTMSRERVDLLRSLGAEVVLTEGAKGMAGSIERAEQLAHELGDAFIPRQFDNPANARAHYETTGPELLRDAGGEIDFFVATVGTGGTLTGTGRYLKEKLPEIKIIAVEPAESPVLAGGEPGPHGIQGIGANFVPKVLDRSLIDEIIPIDTAAARAASRELMRTEGLMVGISSGAAAAAAAALAARPENRGKVVATLLPDTGERYLSTGLYTE
ncbi:cysteine synthase A [Feifania hominis]|uniref:cysteine synthase n=1 Tax=Feifania hominis TaxID=2763660 RepID=A0A926DEP4_9FIRM|nr:cysteine synthase A [Feifania hominis]MBC8536456.1 cysteine synthase A [Feifania hominis]